MPATVTSAPSNTDINFLNTKNAFAIKPDGELKRAHFLFRLMQSKWLVKLGGMLLRLALKMHIPVEGLVKNTIYKHFCGGETVNEALQTATNLQNFGVQTVLDYAAEGGESESAYDSVTNKVLQNIKLSVTNRQIGCISLKMTGIGSKEIFEKLNNNDQLTTQERASYRQIAERLDLICHTAHYAGVIIYIDAEESWMQDPIDTLAEEMMRRYNTYQPIVFNTLQMYRKDRLAYCEKLINDARENKYIAGIKIVRGAYHEKEALRAKQKGYENPICDSKEDTDKSFDGAIELCLKNIDACALCAATHNQKSVTYLLDELEHRNLQQYKDRILFSQLYGMSDNLTFNLAKAGWHASKYLPYGEVKTAIPYLLRRAEENTSMSGQMGRELLLIKRELERRRQN
jgi:proline dehydrogenase